jgi:UDP-2,3-diacylglucosamine pyrophosphatase LpxH
MDVRKLDVAVISDVHLATHACKAKKLLKYLKSIAPTTLVLNGDIIDSWRFSRNYFPKTQLKLVRHIIKMLEKGVKVIYLSGNHDEFLRRLTDFEIGNLIITDQLVLELNGEKTWIFHGDIFDHIIHNAKWLAKFGAASYGLLTVINKFINFLRNTIGYDEVMLYRNVKKRVLRNKEHVSTNFEKTVCQAAFYKKCTTVICGHTHLPKDKIVTIKEQTIRYINCGDWVEHFTSAEYVNNNWTLYHYLGTDDDLTNDETEIVDSKEYYHKVFNEVRAACL